MAAIIRLTSAREEPAGRPVQPVAFNFEDMHGRAHEYLDTVRHEATKIVHQAHQQAELVRNHAEAAGRKAAEEAIERILDEKIAKRMETLLPALAQVVSQVNDAKADWLRHWEQSAVRISTAIAERIIRRELKERPEITLDVITEALQLAAGAADVSLHLNPTDYEHLGAQVNRLAESLCQLAPTDIVADPAISPGGCLVETKFGQVDMQIESQLRRIEEELSSE